MSEYHPISERPMKPTQAAFLGPQGEEVGRGTISRDGYLTYTSGDPTAEVQYWQTVEPTTTARPIPQT